MLTCIKKLSPVSGQAKLSLSLSFSFPAQPFCSLELKFHRCSLLCDDSDFNTSVCSFEEKKQTNQLAKAGSLMWLLFSEAHKQQIYCILLSASAMYLSTRTCSDFSGFSSNPLTCSELQPRPVFTVSVHGYTVHLL